MSNGDKSVTTTNHAQSNGRPPTSADVGRLAGVSRSTVSLVLNEVPDSRIPDETRERVLVAAKQLGYIPNAAATALRGGQNNLILIPFFNRPYSFSFNIFYDELAGRLTQLGYLVMFHRDRVASGPELARQWASLRPVGVLVESHRLDEEAREILYRAGTRAIQTIDATVSSEAAPDWIEKAGIIAAEHFITAGHHSLGAVVPRETDITTLGLRRLQGVEKIARQHGLKVERIDLALDRQDAFILAQRWRRNPHPTGVFAYNDEYAILLMNALQDQGIEVPKDVAIIGCDNLRICEFLRPRLTSISLHPDVAGRALADKFHAMIEGEPYKPVEPGEATLIVRDSA